MRKLIDLTGQRFGRWRVISYAGNKKWNCECSCEKHTKAVVSGYTLRSGSSISCGCYAKEQRKKAEELREQTDLIGVTRGNFTAIKYIGNNTWLCRCKCGSEIELSRRAFLDCYRKSCGCDNFLVDLSGKKFGMWTVIKYSGGSKWLCRCDCGTESQVGTNQLLQRKSLKCKRHRHKNIIVYPQWFIDELNDKSLVSKINTHDVVEFICKEHGVYSQRVGEHIRLSDNTRKSGCPKCASVASDCEREIAEFISARFPQYRLEYHNRDILDGKEIDIYLPDIRIGIEYNGSAFHATENGLYGNKDKYYHRDKFLLAKEKGIHLISVFDIDYINNKLNVLSNIYNILCGDINNNLCCDSVVYTDNDYDDGNWLRKLGYKEECQVDPESFVYRGRLVYRCGKTKWILYK